MIAQIFTNANSFDTVSINLGNTFVIKLRDQPGEHMYSKEDPVVETVWKMEAGEGLRLLREQFTPDVTDTKTGPGIHEWEYEAVKPGIWEIEGSYTIFRFGGEERFKLTVKVI
ncbi:hypothetical protein MSLAZ_0117 [Methanosarcina lacustris Z-7289]|uniref:Proteinase inhibitor I42 chagasin domain-containing protein n=1 Tax=Methanosarcina lacustris Z-7289 TaxID=1434111 RepID=A0A0E3S3R3_9EURY|nr:protease inhibitor I42 family protein [Methanosarcina lacustris]AKB73378.1 hypothetical protein MSLAZ_0117 [Methanosarcina lacustris Z-7289]